MVTHRREHGGFERSKVGEIGPVPRRQQNIIDLDIPVTEAILSAVLKRAHELECYPLLLYDREKGARVEPVIQVAKGGESYLVV